MKNSAQTSQGRYQGNGDWPWQTSIKWSITKLVPKVIRAFVKCLHSSVDRSTKVSKSQLQKTRMRRWT